MNRDLEAVVWTRLAVKPMKMGRIYLTDTECRFTYDPDYLVSGLPGLGLVLSPAIYQDRTIVRQRTGRFDFLPPIQGLMPPRDTGNFQRNLALRYLREAGYTGTAGFETDWEILKLVGHGGIGHLDVFEDDENALRWYSQPARHALFDMDEDAPFSYKDFLTWFDGEADTLIQLIGPTPSVGGAIPKLLISIPDSGWDHRIGPPTRGATAGVTDVVLKFEQSATYPGITELEALALDVHRDLGFEVPRYWLTTFKEIPALAVERFDRDASHTPVFTETLFSVIASGNPDILNHYDFSYDGIAKALGMPDIALVSDRDESLVHLFRRLVASFITGNGDLHLENLSILVRGDQRGFSPVYDPTPMRAYSIHNMLNVMPFGNYGEFVTGHDDPIRFGEALQRFARACGIRPSDAGGIITDILEKTNDYPERIDALGRVPPPNKKELTSVYRMTRKLLEQSF
ncbi:MAG TPA: type II toxin-antitoxin system HipA family toxin [Gammaproteobacteria bacterium]|nr:type II toxin-antitoxin system HipA family toxin [Gammaproteobacteria bacterium]